VALGSASGLDRFCGEAGLSAKGSADRVAESKRDAYLFSARHAGATLRYSARAGATSTSEQSYGFLARERDALTTEVQYVNDNLRNRRPPRQPAGRVDGANRHRQNGPAGNAHQKYERYVALAREATRNGDPVEAENFYQHAEHYFRVMRERAA
jgi:hypothetical protein